MAGSPLDHPFDEKRGLEPASIGRAIRFFRLQAGLSQIELSERCRLSQSRISAMETGTSMLIDNLNGVAAALNLDVMALLQVSIALKSPESEVSRLTENFFKLAGMMNRNDIFALVETAEALQSDRQVVAPAWAQEAEAEAPAWRLPGSPEYEALQAEMEASQQLPSCQP